MRLLMLGTRFACRFFSSSASITSQTSCFYQILGLTSLASLAEIKRAYRLKAMRHHPDHAEGRGSVAEFIAVSSAYEVLSDASQRRAYDESRRAGNTASVDNAASSNRHAQPASKEKERSSGDPYTSAWASASWRSGGGRVRAAEESATSVVQTLDPKDVEKWRYKVGSWYLKASGNLSSSQSHQPSSLLGRYLDRYQREVEGDLRHALSHAYLGPTLHHLAKNQLPKHFEAEERTDLSSDNILNLISGRSLLGSISLTEATDEGSLGHDLQVSTKSDQDNSPPQSFHHPPPISFSSIQSGGSRSLFGPTLEPAFDPLRFLDPPDKREADRASGDIVIRLLGSHKGGSEDPSKSVLGGSRLRKERFPSYQQDLMTEEVELSFEGMAQKDATKEEREVEDRGTRASKFEEDRGSLAGSSVNHEVDDLSHDLWTSTSQESTSSPLLDPPPRSWTTTSLSEGAEILHMSLGGKAWARAVRDPPSPSASPRRITVYFRHRSPPHDMVVILDDGIYNCDGKRIGHLIRLGLIGVHTIHVFDTSDRKIKLLCRMTRSQPLPSSTWLFPPRVQTHSGASWYVEWGGYLREGKEGWLDPAVHLFLAAFATMDFENGGKNLLSRSKMMLGIW